MIALEYHAIDPNLTYAIDDLSSSSHTYHTLHNYSNHRTCPDSTIRLNISN